MSILYVPKRNTLGICISQKCFEVHENVYAKSGAPVLRVSQTNIIFITKIFKPCLGWGAVLVFTSNPVNH